MAGVGEIRTGKERCLAGKHHSVIWAACGLCGKERWVQVLGGKPQWSHCRECGRKLRKHNRPRIVTEEQRHPQTKKCNKCGVVYPATRDYFAGCKGAYSGISSPCKKCLNARTRDRLLEQGKIKYHKTFLTPKERRVAASISISIRRAIALGKNGRHWESLIGYTLKDLMRHIEKQFTKGMNWNNYGFNLPNNNPPRWHIDHITPKSVFNLESPDSMDVKRCWALSNLRPLWGSENSKKGAQVLRPFQPSLKF